MEYGSRSRSEHYVVWLVILAVVGGLVAFVAYNFLPSAAHSAEVVVGAKTFQAKSVAVTSAREAKIAREGLVGRDQVLLLRYDKKSAWAVEANELKLPVDTVWISENKKVLYVYKRMQPAPTAVYNVPTNNVRYVLHLPEGSIDKYSIYVGKMIQFDERGAA